MKAKISSKNKTLKKAFGTYATFIEENDWEGETWNSYILVDDTFVKFMDAIEALGDEAFRIEFDGLSASDVKVLARQRSRGYGKPHDGPFKLNEPFDPEEITIDSLYKGGITSFVSKVK